MFSKFTFELNLKTDIPGNEFFTVMFLKDEFVIYAVLSYPYIKVLLS